MIIKSLEIKKLLIVVLFSGLFFNTYSQQASSVSNKLSVQEYINTYKHIAIKNMIEFGIPASITMAQGILESGYGNSELARYANNHFGIKCHKDWEGDGYYIDDDEINECFRKYKSPEQSFSDHSLFLTERKRYADLFLLEITDYKGWAHGLKKAGYATSPTYATRLIEIIEKYKLYEIDLLVTEKYITHSYTDFPEEDKDNPQQSNQEKDKGSGEISLTKVRYQSSFNRIKYTIAEKGDTYESIAFAYDMMPWQILRYNDLDKNRPIKEGDRIYLQPKRNKGEQDFHIVQSGETMREISQKNGVKLKKLYKYNNMEVGSKVVTGQKIVLKGKGLFN